MKQWLFSLIGSLEALVFGLSFFWGLWVTFPFSNVPIATPTFSALEVYAPRWVWGWVQMLFVTLLIVTSSMGWRRTKRNLLLGMVMWTALVWAVIALAYVQATTTPMYLAAVVLYGWLWVVNKEQP